MSCIGKILKEKRLVEKHPQVGLFFVIDGDVYGDGDTIDNINPVEDFINYDVSHNNYWDNLISWGIVPKHLKDKEYFDIPRGRIVYNVKTRTFTVYAARSIINDPELRDKVLDDFDLSGKRVNFEFDDHYALGEEMDKVYKSVKR